MLSNISIPISHRRTRSPDRQECSRLRVRTAPSPSRLRRPLFPPTPPPAPSPPSRIRPATRIPLANTRRTASPSFPPPPPPPLPSPPPQTSLLRPPTIHAVCQLHSSHHMPSEPLTSSLFPKASRLSNIRDQPLQPSAPFAAHLQPYPGATALPSPTAPPSYSPSVMNPPYQMNGSPYPSSPSPYHQNPSTGSPANGQSANVSSTIPAHPTQYQYAVHHNPYGHPYTAYPQYSGMMMYQPAAGAHPDSSQQASSSAPPPATGKRKRKYTHDSVNSRASDEEGADSGTDIQRVGSGSAAPIGDSKKRTKTQRACDSCRSRKIRSVPRLTPATLPVPDIHPTTCLPHSRPPLI